MDADVDVEGARACVAAAGEGELEDRRIEVSGPYRNTSALRYKTEIVDLCAVLKFDGQ